MGDILGGVFGGGQRTTQQVTPDPTAQALNKLRLQELQRTTRGGGSLANFAGAMPDIYTASPDVQNLMQFGLAGFDPSQFAGGTAGDLGGYGFDQYRQAGYNRDLYERGLGDVERELGRGRGLQEGAYGRGREALDQGYVGGLTMRDADVRRAQEGITGRYTSGMLSGDASLQDALARTQGTYGQVSAGQGRTLQDALARSTANYQQALDPARGYLAQIATPQIMQQMALQGLEGGGAVPAALAQAAAQVGTPLAQQYMSEQTGLSQAGMGQQAALGGQYMGELTGLGQTGMGLRGALGQQALGAEASLGQAGLALGGQLGGQRLAGLAGLSEADMAGLGQLLQASMGQRSALTGQQMGTEAGFTQTIPGAAQTFNLLPAQRQLMGAQAAGARAQAAQTMFPMADYSRSLREQDVLRRQGVATSAFTGIPFTPGSETAGRTSQKPLFNFFGAG